MIKLKHRLASLCIYIPFLCFHMMAKGDYLIDLLSLETWNVFSQAVIMPLWSGEVASASGGGDPPLNNWALYEKKAPDSLLDLPYVKKNRVRWRCLEGGDADAIVDMHQDYEAKTFFCPDIALDDPSGREMLLKIYFHGDHRKAYNDNFGIVRDTLGYPRLVGLVAYWCEHQYSGDFFFSLIIHRDERGKGFGRETLQYLLAILAACRVTSLNAWVHSGNIAMTTFLTSLGFVKIREEKKSGQAEQFTAFLYQKRLNQDE